MLLLLSAILFQGAHCASCANKNSFIPILKDKGVKILDSPTKNYKKCGKEWSTYGACCDDSTLTTYAKEDKQNIGKTFEKMWDEVSVLEKTLKELKPLSTVFSAKFKKLLGELGEGSLTTTPMQEAFNRFLEISDDLLKQDPKKEILTSCIDRLASMRSASLCNTCSGRSERYFSPAGLAQISLHDCQLTINDCVTTWKIMVKVISATTYMKKFMEQLQSSSSSLSRESFTSTDEVDAWMKEADIKAHLASCQTANNGKVTCPIEHSKSLCNKLIRLQRKVKKIPLVKGNDPDQIKSVSKLVSSKLSILNRDSSDSQNEIAHIAQSQAKKAKSTTNPGSQPVFDETTKWQRRILQLLNKKKTCSTSSTKSTSTSSTSGTTSTSPSATSTATTTQTTSSTTQPTTSTAQGEVVVMTANYTSSGTNSSMDLSLTYP